MTRPESFSDWPRWQCCEWHRGGQGCSTVLRSHGCGKSKVKCWWDKVMVGLGGLKGLSEPECFCVSAMLWLSFAVINLPALLREVAEAVSGASVGTACE